jgi:hypothetical protein
MQSTLSEKVQNLVRDNKLNKWFISRAQEFQQFILGQKWLGCLTLIVDV